MPTAGAVVSDLIFAATHGEHRYSPYKNTASPDRETAFAEDFASAYFLRVNAADEAGMLSKISAILGRCGIAIESIFKTAKVDGTAKLTLITRPSHERAMKAALAKFAAAGHITVESLIRVAD